MRRLPRRWLTFVAASMGLGMGFAGGGPGSPAKAYTVDQALAGQQVYEQNCGVCHGANLQGSFFIPPLAGRTSRIARSFSTAADMHAMTSQRMPQDRPGVLPAEQYWDVLAFILSQNSEPPGDVPLGPDNASTVYVSVGSPPVDLASMQSASPDAEVLEPEPDGMGTEVEEPIPIEDVMQE